MDHQFFRKNRFQLSVLMILLAGFLSACTHQGDQFTGKVIDQRGQASVHEVSNKTIRSYMHKLDTIVFEPYYSELERDQYRFRYTSKIVNVVNELTKELEQYPGLKLGLNEQEQQEFLALASQLKQQVEQLNSLLTDQKSSEIKTVLAQLAEVCNSCHQKFRSR